MTLEWLAAAALVQLPAPASPGSIESIELVCLEHLDIGFTASPQEVARRQKLHLDHALALCEERPDFRWTIESVWQLEEWLARTPEPAARARLVDLVRAGRVEVGAALGNFHTGLMSPELLFRAFEPAGALRRELAIEITAAVQDDVPGFTSLLPSALAQRGIRYFLAGVNTSFGGGTTLAPGRNPFWWEGTDGSRVLTWVAPGSYVEAETWGLGIWQREEEADAKVASKLAELAQAGYVDSRVLVMASVGDNGDPDAARAILRHVDGWNAKHSTPKIRFTTPSAFLAEVAARDDSLAATVAGKLAVVRGDWAGHWEPVKASGPAATALFREAQALLLPAEALSLQATLELGRPDPAHDLADAVRRLLVFAEHSQPGGVGWPRLCTQDEVLQAAGFTWEQANGAAEILRALVRNAVDAFAEQLAADGESLVVLNPSPFTRTDLAEVPAPPVTLVLPFRLLAPDGSEVVHELEPKTRMLRFVVRELPGLGLARYRIVLDPVTTMPAGTTPGSVELREIVRRGDHDLEPWHLANDDVAVELDSAGIVRFLGSADRKERWLAETPLSGSLLGLTSFESGSCLVALTTERTRAIDSPWPIVTGRAGPVTGELVFTRPGEPLAESRLRITAGIARVEWEVTVDLAALAKWPELTDRMRLYVQVALGSATATSTAATVATSDRASDPAAWQFIAPGGVLDLSHFLPGGAPGTICTLGGIRRTATTEGAMGSAGSTLRSWDLLLREPFALQFTPAWLAPPIAKPQSGSLSVLLLDQALTGETRDRGPVAFPRLEPTPDERRTFHLAFARGDATPLEDAAQAFQLPLIVRHYGPWFRAPAKAVAAAPLITVAPANVRLRAVRRVAGPDDAPTAGASIVVRVEETAGVSTRRVHVRVAGRDLELSLSPRASAELVVPWPR